LNWEADDKKGKGKGKKKQEPKSATVKTEPKSATGKNDSKKQQKQPEVHRCNICG